MRNISSIGILLENGYVPAPDNYIAQVGDILAAHGAYQWEWFSHIERVTPKRAYITNFEGEEYKYHRHSETDSFLKKIPDDREKYYGKIHYVYVKSLPKGECL